MIHVVRAAGQTTVQDLGRPGHRGRGIVPGGAADTLALVTANLLVGNPAGAAALEMTLLGPTLSVDRPTTIVSNIAGCRVHLWVAADGSGIWIDRHGRIYEDR